MISLTPSSLSRFLAFLTDISLLTFGLVGEIDGLILL